MALRHAAALVLFAASVVAGSPAHAQNAPITNAPITNPPNVITPPAALPDLVAIKATFVLTCAGDKKSLTASYAVTVANKGPYAKADLTNVPFKQLVEANWGTTTGTDDNLEKPLKPPTTQVASGPAIMKPNDTFSTTMIIIDIPHHKKSLPNPQYVLWVRVDPHEGVPESDEKNNFTGKYFLDPCRK